MGPSWATSSYVCDAHGVPKVLGLCEGPMARQNKDVVIGRQSLPYIGHYTNAAIENYHSNLKAILKQSKGRTHGSRVDWIIY